MGKMELEVKILEINEEEIIKKIESLGGFLKEECNQYLYTYDLPTIYGRYMDILLQINEPENEIKKEVAIEKLKLLFFELDNVLTIEQRQEIKRIIKVNNMQELLEKENFIKMLNKQEVIEFVKQFHNNSKKWIRLRKTNKQTTIAIKHILADNDTSIQQMLETEIEVESMQKAKEFLQALGYRHKSYQEKRRKIYVLEKYEIDIDTWPHIPTYMEIEGENEEDITYILNKLGYSMKDAISCTADDIYRKYGNNTIFEQRELKF